jgi:DNA-binding transcriptional LysR family regulator
MPRDLPSTRALQVFSAVARHQSLSQAAEELCLTHSALSQQLSKLEDQLGVTLLRRSPRGIALTEAGRHYREHVEADLSRLRSHMMELMARREAETTLLLGAVPVLADRWLVPRLARFQARRPDVSLQLKVFPTTDLFVDDRHFDVAIHYLDVVWPGARREALMEECCVPVCHPQAPFMRRLSGADFRGVPLVHLTTRPDAWQNWFAQTGLARIPENPLAGLRVDFFSTMLEAVRAQLGIGLMPRYAVERELRSGELVLAHRHVLPATQTYALIVPEHRLADGTVAALRDWLMEEVARPVSD